MLADNPIDVVVLAPDLEAPSGNALHAWIVDPGKNTIGIDQQKRAR